ncbi:MAG: UbiA family prenyltransferase [Candidatus Diapherotrites archaeon]|uniref:UbiA family prenyltransferase n=1 Tax=Candidatus Iainarchaeum sp. TaxID=3101447 RepID=A0A7J4IZV6_9ARCH|nr:MAG: 4-hydroxybenzoate octaprenyltransferase [archaeon GW2011_AR10]MBS3059455.1 UbiA family prenyltransferase [Candidatus Diapherotrites archaeon]HIH08516.1 UbiA family prenyltransferase [Candidatus Diapherotrites archaeon]
MGLEHFFEILRPFNCFMAAFAVFIGYAVSVGSIGFSFQVFLAMVSAFLICGAGQAVNDFFDWRIDRKIKPFRPIPAGHIESKAAFLYSVMLFLIGITISFFINEVAFLIAVLFSLLLLAYSAYTPQHKYFGNALIAMSTAITLVFGASVSGNYSVVVLLAASAFFSSLGREITKDVEDSAEKGFKKTLPMILPIEQINLAVFGSYIAGISIALYVWFSGMLKGAGFLFLTLAAGGIFLYAGAKLAEKDAKASQELSKIAMFIALIAFLAGVM